MRKPPSMNDEERIDKILAKQYRWDENKRPTPDEWRLLLLWYYCWQSCSKKASLSGARLDAKLFGCLTDLLIGRWVPRQSHHTGNSAPCQEGTPTPASGIYRCESCGFEVDSTRGNPLPPTKICPQLEQANQFSKNCLSDLLFLVLGRSPFAQEVQMKLLQLNKPM